MMHGLPATPDTAPNLLKDSKSAQRDQALERRPSSAWARKMLPLIRAKTIVTVSIIAVVLRRPRIEQNDVSPRTVKTISRRAENRNLTDDLEQQYP
jgi:hypothetical protein